MQVLMAILILVILGGAVAITCTMTSITNMRRVAAWLVGRALYLENLQAERTRCREMGDDLRRAVERDLGVA